MIESLYNVIKVNKENVLVYNTLTNAFVKIEISIWKSLWSNEAKEYRKILYKQGILVDSNPAEIISYKYKYYGTAFKNSSLHLAIAPTMKCNFACFYCFEEGNKNLPLMDENVENALITFIEKNKRKNISINWFGGEPLLGFDRIVSICKRLKEKEIKFKSSLITNGSLLTVEKIQQLDFLNLSFIQITLDGLAEIHDKRRYFKNGKPSFDIILFNIENFLKMTSIPLTIQVTTDHSNESAYEDVVNFFEHKFSNYLKENQVKIGCNYVLNRTNFEKSSSCYTHQDIIKENIKSLQRGEKNGKTPYLPGLSMPCMYRSISSFAIDSQGNIYRCLEHLGNPSCRIGNLPEGKISLSKMAETTFENDPFEDEECIHCNVFPVCGGGCPLDRSGERKGKSRNCCSVYKDRLSDLLPYLYENQYKKLKQS